MHSIDGVNENIPYNNAVLYVLMYTQMYPFTPSILGIAGLDFFLLLCSTFLCSEGLKVKN